MATRRSYFTRSAQADWEEVDFVAIVRVEADEVVVLNSDGTETRLQSAAGDLQLGPGGLSGTVTSITRTSEDGAIVYEAVHGISLAAGDLMAAAGQLFDLVLETAAAIGPPPWSTWSLDATLAAWNVVSLLDYTHAGGGVTADLGGALPAGGTVKGAGPSAGLIGSAYGDVLIGDGAGNLLMGGAGNDTLAGGGGPDMLIGGAGMDTADYSASATAVTVDLGAGRANGGAGTGDVLVGIESIIGSSSADRLLGDAGNNTITGGAGNDIVTLGAGHDALVLALGSGLDTVTDFAADGTDVIVLEASLGVTSFADLVDQHLITSVGGHAAVVLGGGDGVVLQSIASPTQLTAASFQFLAPPI